MWVVLVVVVVGSERARETNRFANSNMLHRLARRAANARDLYEAL